MHNPMLDLFFDYQASIMSESFRSLERMINAAKLPPMASHVKVAHSPQDVVYVEDTLQLLRFRNDSVDIAEPVLICYAFVRTALISWTSIPTAASCQLLKRGFDVYLINWGVPTAADRSLRPNTRGGRTAASAAG